MAIDLQANNFEVLKYHVGHTIVCSLYGDNDNVAIECETCGTILLDYNNPNKEGNLEGTNNVPEPKDIVVGYQVIEEETKDYLFDGDHKPLPYIHSWIVFNEEDTERLLEIAKDKGFKPQAITIFEDDIEGYQLVGIEDYF